MYIYVYFRSNILTISLLLCNIYIFKYYSAIKNKEILSFVTTWMELEDIMINEISQRQILYDLANKPDPVDTGDRLMVVRSRSKG